MDKVDHLLKLADEYQAMPVFDLCVKCLKDKPKSKENSMRILYLANSTVMAREEERLDIVRQVCYSLIGETALKDIMGKEDFKSLDRDSSESVLVKRTERLETFLKEVYPQLIGLAEFCIFLCLENSNYKSSITRCPQHFTRQNKANQGLRERIQTCLVCQKMIGQLVSLSGSSIFANKECLYGGNCYFNQDLISIIQNFKDVSTLPPMPIRSGFFNS